MTERQGPADHEAPDDGTDAGGPTDGTHDGHGDATDDALPADGTQDGPLADVPVPAEPAGPSSDDEVDLEFARIMSGWDSEADLSGREIRPTPAASDDLTLDDLAPDDLVRPLPSTTSDPAPPAVPVTGWRAPSTTWDPAAADAVDEGHFEPPAPAPLPPYRDWQFWATLVGLGGGPLLLLIIVALKPGWGAGVTALAVALTIGGFLLLVLRGSGRSGPDDDGAQV